MEEGVREVHLAQSSNLLIEMVADRGIMSLDVFSFQAPVSPHLLIILN